MNLTILGISYKWNQVVFVHKKVAVSFFFNPGVTFVEKDCGRTQKEIDECDQSNSLQIGTYQS